MKWFFEIIVVIVLFFVVCFIYSGQQRITLNNNPNLDPTFYYKIAAQFQQGTIPVKGELPFIKRMGTFFLIGTYSRITGTDLTTSALLVNLAGTLIGVLLLLFWLRIFIDILWIRLLLLSLFMLHWLVPLRFSFYCPMLSDSWGSAWFLGALLMLNGIQKSYRQNKTKVVFWKVLFFSILAGIGSSFRESNIVLALSLFFIANPFKNLNVSIKTLIKANGINAIQRIRKLYFVKQTLFFFLPFIFILSVDLLVSHFTETTHEYHYAYIPELFRFFYTKTLPQYLLGIFNAYGPLILLAPFYFKEFKALLSGRQELLILLISSFGFGYVAGSHTERLAFMTGFPLVFIFIGLAIKNLFYSPQRWWLFILLILQTFAFRFYWATPEYTFETKNIPIPFFTLIGNHFPATNLLSTQGNFVLNSILLVEYLVLFIATFFVIRNKISLTNFKSFGRSKSI